jgi:hypothetical protein
MFLEPFDRSQVPTPYGTVCLLYRFCFRVHFFNFRISTYPVSRAGILSQSWAQRQDIFLLVLHRKINESSGNSTYGGGGLQKAP